MDQSSPNFFAEHRRKCRSNSFPTLDISVRSRDICAQSGKESETGPKLATMWQNFAEIHPQILEISS